MEQHIFESGMYYHERCGSVHSGGSLLSCSVDHHQRVWFKDPVGYALIFRRPIPGWLIHVHAQRMISANNDRSPRPQRRRFQFFLEPPHCQVCQCQTIEVGSARAKLLGLAIIECGGMRHGKLNEDKGKIGLSENLNRTLETGQSRKECKRG
jgi:hypothetical protein